LYLSVYFLSVSLSVCLPIYLCVCMSVCLIFSIPVCLFILSLSVFAMAVYLDVCLSFAPVCVCSCIVFACPSVCRLPSDSATEERLVNRVLVRTRLVNNRQGKYLYQNNFCLKIFMLRHPSWNF
jgi:hypothetical protein